MNKQLTRRRRASRAAARTVAVGVAVAALIATLGAGQALAGPDERVLERQGMIDRQAAAGQADEEGRVALPPQLSSEDKAAFRQAEQDRSQQKATEVPRRWIRPEPPTDPRPRLDLDDQLAPAPTPPAPASDRTGLVISLTVSALLLALGAATTWRIRHRHPQTQADHLNGRHDHQPVHPDGVAAPPGDPVRTL